MGKVNLHIFLTILIIALAINVFFLDVIVFSSRPQSAPLNADVTPEQIATGSGCQEECLEAIKDAVTDEISRLPKSTPKPVPRTTTVVAPKEIFIPLGSGSTRSTEWADLPSMEVYIDTNNYGSIESVVFESYLRIGTGVGTVYAKLYNVTDKHDVWFSEVALEGSGTLHREAEITLEPGRKLYRVMAKSRLGAEAFVENARLRITTK